MVTPEIMDPKKKQKALRMISNGIYILTSRSGQKFGGATITWLSQASFKPPLIMAAVRPDSSVFECMHESGKVVVHLLGEHQLDMARKFLSTTEIVDGLMNGEPFLNGEGLPPVLRNVPAYVECTVVKILDGGDHSVVVLEVVNAELLHDVKPLLVAQSPWTYGG